MRWIEGLESRTLCAATLPVVGMATGAEAWVASERTSLRVDAAKPVAKKGPAPFTPSSPQTYVARTWEGWYKVRGGSAGQDYFQAKFSQSGRKVSGQMAVLADPLVRRVTNFRVSGTIDPSGRLSIAVTGTNTIGGVVLKTACTFTGQVSRNGRTITGSFHGNATSKRGTVSQAGTWSAHTFSPD